jgi:hypothetical protein
MADIREWRVEDSQFWETTGKGIANRNLWISIPSLLCGFAVWIYWSVITVQMLNAGFPFKPAELFTLAAIAGLDWGDPAHPIELFHPHRRRSQHHRVHYRTVDDPGAGYRYRLAEQGNAVVGIPTAGVSVRVSAAAISLPACPTSASSSPSGCRAWRWA